MFDTANSGNAYVDKLLHLGITLLFTHLYSVDVTEWNLKCIIAT